jgi:tRNA pseudouridine38-40 synthase
VFVLEYQGTCYAGFQVQGNALTVQGEIEKALHKLTGETIRIRGASRTDAGAHAKGQVVDFLAEATFTAETFAKGVNAYLPEDIKVRESYEAGVDFNSRHSALSRVYRYNVLNSVSPSPLLRKFVHWVKVPLNMVLMGQASRLLEGVHDFRSLAGGLEPGRNTVRRVDRWEVWGEGEMVIIEAEASGFLPHQVRKTNSMLVEVGLGRLDPLSVTEILIGNDSVLKHCPYLPAKGLTLMGVKYKQFPPKR